MRSDDDMCVCDIMQTQLPDAIHMCGERDNVTSAHNTYDAVNYAGCDDIYDAFHSPG